MNETSHRRLVHIRLKQIWYSIESFLKTKNEIQQFHFLVNISKRTTDIFYVKENILVPQNKKLR